MCPVTGRTRGQVLELEVTWTELRGKREPVGVFKIETNDQSGILGRWTGTGAVSLTR